MVSRVVVGLGVGVVGFETEVVVVVVVLVVVVAVVGIGGGGLVGAGPASSCWDEELGGVSSAVDGYPV